MFPNSNTLLSFLRKRHFLIAISVSLLCFIAEGFFLYYYFYRPLALTKILVELRQQTAVEELRVSLYDSLTAFFAQKQKEFPLNWDTLRDPFNFLPLSAAGEAGTPTPTAVRADSASVPRQ